MRNSVVDNFAAINDGKEQEAKDEEVVAKKGSWYAYLPDSEEFEGPYRTKGDAIKASQDIFASNSYEEETVWLCQAVQKVIFTRKVHVVESDE